MRRVLTCHNDCVHSSTLLSKLHTADGASHSRPRPRRPDFLRPLGTAVATGDFVQPHSKLSLHTVPRPRPDLTSVEGTASDAYPRGVVLQPSSPPIQFHHLPASSDTTFAFQPSSCSEQSPLKSDLNDCSSHSRMSESVPPKRIILAGSGLVDSQSLDPKRTTTTGHVLLPPAAFETQRTNDQYWLSPQTPRHSGATAKAHISLVPSEHQGAPPTSLPTIQQPSQSTAPLSSRLSAPSMKSEIIEIRDHLQQFHALKTQQKALQDQLSQAEAEDNHSQISVVRQQCLNVL